MMSIGAGALRTMSYHVTCWILGHSRTDDSITRALIDVAVSVHVPLKDLTGPETSRIHAPHSAVPSTEASTG